MLAVGERVLGDDIQLHLPLATPLGGGVAGTQQEMCGALSGGVLLIGALHGRRLPGQDDTLAYRLTNRYLEGFRAALGDTQCARLRRTVVYGAGGLGSCAVLAGQAARILHSLLTEGGQQG